MGTVTDLFSTQRPLKVGQANGEFLANLAMVKEGRKSLEWLRTQWNGEINPDFAKANIKHWGLK